MINEFMFAMKTDIRFGRGLSASAGQIALEYGAKKVMLVADKGIRATGLPGRVEESLKAAGLEVINYDRIVPNPRLTDCEEGARQATAAKVNLLVAVGGGSSIDTAKAIAGMLGHGTTDFEVIRYPQPYEHDPYPLIVIPTTAGTGSEVTTCGVITDEKTQEKVYCYHPKCAPTVALCDPEVLMGLPAPIAASTALDALTHAIEGFVNKITSPVTESFGLHAIGFLAKNMRKYYYDRDIDACEAIMVGSLLGGLSFGYSDTGTVHSLAETIGGLYDTPHGVANAIFLADVCEYSLPANLPKYVAVAKALGAAVDGLSEREAAQAGVEEIRKLVADLNIPKFSTLDRIAEENLPFIAERCMRHVSNVDNPRVFTQDDFLHLLKKAYTA